MYRVGMKYPVWWTTGEKDDPRCAGYNTATVLEIHEYSPYHDKKAREYGFTHWLRLTAHNTASKTLSMSVCLSDDMLRWPNLFETELTGAALADYQSFSRYKMN